MPSHICVLCKISTRFVKRRNLPVSFHSFPCDSQIQSRWKEFCGTESGFVCSEHFADNCFIGGRESETNKRRRRLIGWAVPTIRFPANQYEAGMPTAKSSKKNNAPYSSDPIKPESSESLDFKEELDISEVDTISAQRATISQLRSQIRDYKTKLEEASKKLHELDIAICERDCTIDDLQKELDYVTQNLNPIEFDDEIKIENSEISLL